MKDLPNNNPMSAAERKFRTKVKMWFTTLEADEPIHWMDKVIMWGLGIVVLWIVLLVAIAS